MPLPSSCKTCEAVFGEDKNRASAMPLAKLSRGRRVALDCRRYLPIIPRFLMLPEECIDDGGD
jgi:hypothetical protein